MCTIYSVRDDTITTIYMNTIVEVKKIIEIEKIVEVRISLSFLDETSGALRIHRSGHDISQNGVLIPFVSYVCVICLFCLAILQDRILQIFSNSILFMQPQFT